MAIPQIKKVRKDKTLPLPPLLQKKIEDKQTPLTQKLALARQFYPTKREGIKTPGFTNNPLHETRGKKIKSTPFYIHKYPNKLLVLASRRCAVICRYCTRKRITFSKNKTNPKNLPWEVLTYVKQNPQITEVIFSGGDPFIEKANRFYPLINQLLPLKQIRNIRFHSRSIVLKPKLLKTLGWEKLLIESARQAKQEKKQVAITIVVHINHPIELHPSAVKAIKNLKSHGIAMKSQSVLLRRVNDSAPILLNLFQTLIRFGIAPYYLHQLDRVTGSAHFEVTYENGLKIMNELKKKLPACTLPRYVIDTDAGKIDVKDYIAYGKDSVSESLSG